MGKNLSLVGPESVFESVVVIVFQRAFYSEMYQNNIFLIFFKIFLTSTHQNDLKIPKKY
jgi:hypothetical protein